MNKCDRCGKEGGRSMSYFNRDMICLECILKERNHPKYEEARKAEEEQVRQGNHNFPGIGKPPDL